MPTSRGRGFASLMALCALGYLRSPWSSGRPKAAAVGSACLPHTVAGWEQWERCECSLVAIQGLVSKVGTIPVHLRLEHAKAV